MIWCFSRPTAGRTDTVTGIHCAVHSTDSVTWSLNIQPRSPSCLVSQQPSNAPAVLCLDSTLHVLACHLGRFFVVAWKTIWDCKNVCHLLCLWSGYNGQTDQFIESREKERTVRQIISGRMQHHRGASHPTPVHQNPFCQTLTHGLCNQGDHLRWNFKLTTWKGRMVLFWEGYRNLSLFLKEQTIPPSINIAE